MREAVHDGIVLPKGPYRYPYSAVIALLRNAGLFHDPTGDTSTDLVISRDALADGLRELLARGTDVGIAIADNLDSASAELIAAFAATAQLAVEQGMKTPGLVCGTMGELPRPLRFDNAEVRNVEGEPVLTPKLSADARQVLGAIAGAPHPVAESSLRQATGVGGAYLQRALVELSSWNLVSVCERIGLGEAAAMSEPRAEWLGTPEVRLPLAALSTSREVQLARHLGHESLQRGEYESGVYCFGLCESDSPGDLLAYARVLVGAGRAAPAHEIFEQLRSEELPQADALSLGILGLRLAETGLIAPEEAERLLKRVKSTASKVWRARLQVYDGRDDSARNLLRRITREQLEKEPPKVRLEYELAMTACLRVAGQYTKAEKRLREAAELCTTRKDLRRIGIDDDRLAALDLDDSALRRSGGGAILKEVLVPQPVSEFSVRSPREMFASLRRHGATLLATLEGDLLVVEPPGALARPGLATQVRGKLRRMREHPQAFSFGSEEFEPLGPFAGRSALAVNRRDGPVFVLFKPGRIPDVSHLLEQMGERDEP